MHLFLVGAGHVGLVTAVGFLRLGHTVTVTDRDGARIDALADGHPPMFEPGLEEAIRTGLADGSLQFTNESEPPATARFTFVCVGTPSGPRGPLSMEFVEAAVDHLVRSTGPDHVIVVRSTLPLAGPHRLATLVAGREDRPSIVTNPEFMREGQALADFERPSRVVAGWLEPTDRPAAEAVVDLYAGLGAPSLVADARSVALTKIGSNVFLAMKVAFANELARVAEATEADVDTVIDGIGLDARIGTAFMRPGPGFGGSCLPEQALAIALDSVEFDVEAPLLSSIHRSNTTHQGELVRRIEALLGGPGSLGGRRVAVLGLAFKADTDDVRESPGIALAARLREAGAHVVAHDPRAVAKARAVDPDLVATNELLEAVATADAIVVATEWPEYADIAWERVAAATDGRIVYDTRGVVDVPNATRAGFRVTRLGRPQVDVPVEVA